MTKTTVELIKEINDGFVTTSTNKKVVTKANVKVGDQVVVFQTGSTLNTKDLRLAEIEEFCQDGKVIVTKAGKTKVVGAAMLASRFIEIQSALAFERFEWSKLENRPDFDEMVATRNVSDVLGVK